MDDDIRKEVFFKFIINLGIFSALEMDWPAFNVLNATATGLLKELGLLEEFTDFSREMGLPAEHLMAVGKC